MKRKIFSVFVLIAVVFTIVGCGESEPVNTAPVISGTQNHSVEVNDALSLLESVTAFDAEDGDITSSIILNDDALDLTQVGEYEVSYSVRDSENLETIVKVTVTVTPKSELTDVEKAQEDLDAYLVIFEANPDNINLIKRGAIHRSVVTWKSNSPYLSDEGVLLPLPYGETELYATYTATFTFRNAKVTETFEVALKPSEEVELSEERVVPFQNTTTEYNVSDGEISLFYEEDGFVPYVKVEDFFNLLQGFIDPELEMSFVTVEDTLTISYQYYSEDEDKMYDLILTIDATENSISTNDPGFYWAYIYSTETNFGRHIEYDIDNPNAHYIEGNDVIYDLDLYNLDIVVHENEVVLPYYIANQLFAGSSYYNVYYNNQKLVGIYGTPDSDSDEYRIMKTSNMNDEMFPHDLVVHNFNVLAFNLDNFYGLTELLEIESFYELLYESGSRFLTTDPESFEFTLRELLLKKIDEPHTSLGYPGYFNPISFEGAPQNSLTVYGSRFQKWYYDGYVDVDAAIGSKWGEASGSSWNAYSGKRPDYWFLDDEKTSVVITLNGFRTADINEAAAFDSVLVDDILELENSNILPEISGSSKIFYYNSSDESNRFAELLVKGLNASYVDTYKQLLLDSGYTYIVEETNIDSKKDGYYTKNINSVDYMVQVSFDELNALFYVGIHSSVPSAYTSEWPFVVDFKALIESDSAVYLEMTFDRIMIEAPNVINAMMDLTWNTGGNVGALYRVLGFITDQPFVTASIDGDTDGASSSYVYIDGVPVYAHLNWALLTSPLTFSAANSMANIFKMNNLGTIIGLTSGGGASSITPILLPSGTSFTMSSNNVGATRLGDGTDENPYIYVNTEFGIVPDIEITVEEIYDESVLLTAFNQD